DLETARRPEHGRLSRANARIWFALRVRSTARRESTRRASTDGAGARAWRARVLRRARANACGRARDGARLDGRGPGKKPSRGRSHGFGAPTWRQTRHATRSETGPPHP